ncbi:hypothetical protein [Ponticaulis profundi]|uniref:hypothetical protein n=1 Tax=Ponticaulis profundi TaxID=2665222 RepID=UPI00366DC717
MFANASAALNIIEEPSNWLLENFTWYSSQYSFRLELFFAPAILLSQGRDRSGRGFVFVCPEALFAFGGCGQQVITLAIYKDRNKKFQSENYSIWN